MIRIVKRKRTRWLRCMEADGISPTLVAWALGSDAGRNPRHPGPGSTGARLGEQAPDPDREAVETLARRARPRAPAKIAALAPKDLAMAVLRSRVEEVGETLFLDGAPAGLREIVAAAIECGAAIPYPGLHPVPQAYHSGPSYRGARKKIRRTSLKGDGKPASNPAAQLALRPW